MKVSLFSEGDELYHTMLSAIENAHREILLESYIFALDSVGLRFIEILNNRAAQGIDVKIHLDAVGSRLFIQGKTFKKLLNLNIRVKWFHRWSWRRPWQFNIRNHRKLLIVDEKVVFTGGFNIHQQSSLRNFGIKRWRDTHIKIEGPIATTFKTYFNNFWAKRRQRYLGAFEEVDLVPNLSPKCRYLLRCKLKRLILSAQKELLCTTPYFVPDEYIIKALVKAAARGVKVKLLVPFESDHALVNALACHYYSRLIQANISVYAYTPRMLHAKTIVVDETSVMIGSANLDYRSLFINHELVCLFNSTSLAKIMVKEFRNDCQQAILVTKQTKLEIKNWWLWRPLAALLKHWI